MFNNYVECSNSPNNICVLSYYCLNSSRNLEISFFINSASLLYGYTISHVFTKTHSLGVKFYYGISLSFKYNVSGTRLLNISLTYPKASLIKGT